jgi:Ca2+-binding RTX toxin-like protein
MPKFQIFDDFGNGIYRWANFEQYLVVKNSATSWTLVYDEANEGPLNSDEQAATIDVTLVDGKVTKLEYRDEDDHLLARFSGLSLKGRDFEYYIEELNLNEDLFDILARPGLTVVGGEQTQSDDRGDDITTSRWNDVVRARGGNDYIKDVGGADLYDGGKGFDHLTYDNWQWRDPVGAKGIRVDLADGTVRGPDGKIDRLVSIEAVTGTFKADRFFGNGKDNFFEGARGADEMNGRGGFDTISYNNDTNQNPNAHVVVNLGAGTAKDGWGFTDTFVKIEGAVGSHGDDTLIDGRGDNYLNGEGGDDTLVSGRGNDYIEGRDGADTFRFRGTTFGNDTIADFDGADGDRIKIGAAADLGDLTITVDGGDTLIALNGSDAEVRLEGVTSDITSYLIFD